MIKLSTELKQIKGINSRLLLRINRMGIRTVRDLLWHFPFRYEDFSAVVKICDLAINQTATIQGVVRKIDVRRTWQKRMIIVEAFIDDETGGIKAVWFNQPYIARVLQPGRIANFAGKIVFSKDEMCLSNPIYELTSAYQPETKHTAALIPVYPETKGLTSKGLRYLIKPILNNLEKVDDFIPMEILKRFNLPEINTALKILHFPNEISDSEKSKKRFAFEDLFLLQLTNIKLKNKLAKEKAVALKFDKESLEKIIEKLPFKLTGSQRQSLDEILNDLSRPQPMNRLLQGDVGSGKTVIAVIAAIVAAQNGKQSAFMVPTEVLAKQHYRTIIRLFGYLNIPIGLLTNSESQCFYGENLETKNKKVDFLKKVADGDLKIVIGTHAIIARGANGKQNLIFKDLVFTTVDEQHRFGVEQRATLVRGSEKKADPSLPHFLSMSATPIPRTLTLTLFGDLDLSTINELPIGRKQIITKIVAPTNRNKAYQFIREQIKKGRQAFVICPRIEKSEKSENNPTSNIQHLTSKLWDDVRAVKEEYEKLATEIFPDLKIAMLHGKLKSAEKNSIMNDFSENKINILVATSVIEVGVDIPNASIMLIEGADRFGLAQLYQFRGRVGRAEHQSFCLLFTDSNSPVTAQRLQSLLEAKNGFELAEKDLAIRGPGEFLGHTQTGLPDLAMRSLNNIELIKNARLAAEDILKKDYELKNYPNLKTELDKFRNRVHLE